MSSGLVQRRRANVHADNNDSELPSSPSSSKPQKLSSNVNTASDYEDDDKKDNASRGLTLMEEILLLGLRDEQGYLSFFNDSISYVLRGCMLVELSFLNRIRTVNEVHKRPFTERLVEVIDERTIGDALLDESLKYIRMEAQSIGSWIDLLSGETWNLLKIGYQLKQVRERLAKGLVDKGVLRTEKRNFLLFDMATHPIVDKSYKASIIQRIINTLLDRAGSMVGSGSADQVGQGAVAGGSYSGLPDRRTAALICAAYAANVLENAFVDLSYTQREQCYRKVDEYMQEFANFTDRSKSVGATEVLAGVMNVWLRMDNIL